MKILLRLLSICFVSFFLIGATECQHTNTVILPEGPQATQLGKTKDAQISELKAQNANIVAAREADKKQASLAAADLDGVLLASSHVEMGLPRTAIEEEARLGKARLPESDPAEVIKAKDRVIAILQGEVEKANGLYAQANGEAAQAKALAAQKDKDLAQRDALIAGRDQQILVLEKAKADEQKAHVADVQNALNSKDAQIAQIKKDEADKERKWWINSLRFSGLGCILLGAILIVVLKAFPEGGGFIGVGLLIGLSSIGIDMLTAQPWFPIAVGVVGLLILVGIGFAIWRMYKTNTLHTKISAALQDAKDESTTTGSDLWNQISAHLNYRLGDSSSFWGSAQGKALVNMGLVDPKGEAALKATSTTPVAVPSVAPIAPTTTPVVPPTS